MSHCTSFLSSARRSAGIVALASLALAIGCRTEPEPGPLEPRAVRTIDTWIAEADGQLIGRVILMEIEDPAGPIRFHRVVNTSGQWLGYIDDWKRVYRREPFVDHEVYVGMYPMDEGLALLFERETPVRLTPLVEFEAREAGHERPTPDAEGDR